MNISLQGISKKGKQRIKDYGANWRVLDKRSKVLFNNRLGPWLLIVPSSKNDDDAASRWVHGLDDDDFKIMPFAGDSNDPIQR